MRKEAESLDITRECNELKALYVTSYLAFPRQKHLPVCCALGVGHSHTSWAAMSRPLGTVAMGRSPAVTINRLCCPLRKHITFVKVGEQLKLLQVYFPSWTLAGNGRLEPGTSKQISFEAFLSAIWEDCTEQAFQEEAGQVPGASGRSQETEQLENPQIKTPGAAGVT